MMVTIVKVSDHDCDDDSDDDSDSGNDNNNNSQRHTSNENCMNGVRKLCLYVLVGVSLCSFGWACLILHETVTTVQQNLGTRTLNIACACCRGNAIRNLKKKKKKKKVAQNA